MIEEERSKRNMKDIINQLVSESIAVNPEPLLQLPPISLSTDNIPNGMVPIPSKNFTLTNMPDISVNSSDRLTDAILSLVKELKKSSKEMVVRKNPVINMGTINDRRVPELLNKITTGLPKKGNNSKQAQLEMDKDKAANKSAKDDENTENDTERSARQKITDKWRTSVVSSLGNMAKDNPITNLFKSHWGKLLIGALLLFSGVTFKEIFSAIKTVISATIDFLKEWIPVLASAIKSIVEWFIGEKVGTPEEIAAAEKEQKTGDKAYKDYLAIEGNSKNDPKAKALFQASVNSSNTIERLNTREGGLDDSGLKQLGVAAAVVGAALIGLAVTFGGLGLLISGLGAGLSIIAGGLTSTALAVGVGVVGLGALVYDTVVNTEWDTDKAVMKKNNRNIKRLEDENEEDRLAIANGDLERGWLWEKANRQEYIDNRNSRIETLKKENQKSEENLKTKNQKSTVEIKAMRNTRPEDMNSHNGVKGTWTEVGGDWLFSNRTTESSLSNAVSKSTSEPKGGIVPTKRIREGRAVAKASQISSSLGGTPISKAPTKRTFEDMNKDQMKRSDDYVLARKQGIKTGGGNEATFNELNEEEQSDLFEFAEKQGVSENKVKGGYFNYSTILDRPYTDKDDIGYGGAETRSRLSSEVKGGIIPIVSPIGTMGASSTGSSEKEIREQWQKTGWRKEVSFSDDHDDVSDAKEGFVLEEKARRQEEGNMMTRSEEFKLRKKIHNEDYNKPSKSFREGRGVANSSRAKLMPGKKGFYDRNANKKLEKYRKGGAGKELAKRGIKNTLSRPGQGESLWEKLTEKEKKRFSLYKPKSLKISSPEDESFKKMAREAMPGSSSFESKTTHTRNGNTLSNTISKSLPNTPSASIINSSQNLTGGILSSTEPIKKDNKDILLLKMKLEKPIVSPISNPNERMSSFNKLHKDNAELKGTTAVVNNIDNRVTNNSSNSSGGGSTPVLVTKPDVGALKQFSKGY